MSLFVRELSSTSIQDKVIKRELSLSLQRENSVDLYDEDFEIDYDAETEQFDEECMKFMSSFVNEIFQADGYVTQEDKAKFGLLVQHQEGREWFAKLVDKQRVKSMEVNEFVFYRLVQYFAVCLFECNVSDDFSPANTLMNMCFTYHFVSSNIPGRTVIENSKQFVYEYLTEQPIWKSARFWNASWLLAIHTDRKKRMDGIMTGWNAMDHEQKKEFEIGEENSAFAILASFLYMMKALGVSRDDREEFREKMSTIGNLREEQIRELDGSIEILQ
jgi:hypothetical protein